MTTTTIPTFPTPSEINAAVSDLAPDHDRYRSIWQAATDALGIADAPGNPLDDLAAQAATTGTIPTPEQLLDAAHATLEQDRDRRAIVGALETIRRRYLTPPGTTTEQSHQILDYLGREALPAVLDAVRALPKGTPLTAEDALDQEHGPTLLRTARTLLAAYDAIRRQQRAATGKIAASAVTGTDWTVMVAHSGIARNATDWDNYWLNHRRSTGQQYKSGLKQANEQGQDKGAWDYFVTDIPERATWPTIPERATWPENHDDDEQRARWLIRTARDLELWVPNFEELTAEHAANTDRVSLTSWLNTSTRRTTGYDQWGRRVTKEYATLAGQTSVVSTERTWPDQ